MSKYTNYMKLKNWKVLPWRAMYLYVDSVEHFADNIFVKNNLRGIKFIGDYMQDRKETCIVMITLPRKSIKLFKTCMEELENKALLCGFTSYEETCDEVFGGFEKWREAKNTNEETV